MGMDEEAKLKVLESRREYLFRCVQILYDTAKEIEKEPSFIITFRSRFKTLEDVRSEYHAVNEQIQEINLQIKPDLKLDYNKLISFDELYYFVVSVNEQLLVRERERERERERQWEREREREREKEYSDSSPKQNARLPKIELPKFDSNIENWQTFYDTFKNIIHDNKTLSSVEKFHYLISCLSGSALTIAKGVPLTGDNYQHVFDTLIERYKNKRLLVVTYLEKIQNFPQIKNSNFSDLQRLYNTLYESINALKALNVENLGDFILFHAASRALDADTRKRFEIQNESQIPTFKELLEFLQDYVKVLETTQQPSCNPNAPPRSSPPFTKPGKASESRPSSGGHRRSVLTTQNTNVQSPIMIDCLCCGAAHSVYKCPTYQSMNVKARLAFVVEKKMCINCLRKNHTVVQCISKSCCQVCGSRHHTSLHTEKQEDVIKPSPGPSSANNNNTIPTPSQAHTSVHVGRSRDASLVLLGTCTVRVYDAFGAPHHLRALIDSGSQDCFITSACASTLGLPLRRCRLNVAGIGENAVTQVKGITKCTIQPCDISDPKFHIQPIVMDKITTQMPLIELPPIVKERYKHLVLADRNFDKPSDIHLLLGAELFHDIYDGQRINLEPGLPAALHSVFGWVLTGPLDIAKYSPPSRVSSLFASTLALDDVVKRFWEVEEPPQTRLCSPEDEECERLYKELTYREPDGRYVVPLLLKNPNAELGKSYDSSLSHLLNLEKRLNRHEQLKDEYAAFMREYECLGHMQKLNDTDPTQGKYFIPHHCVIRPESTTTRLRVVFNASSPTSNKLSLNDLVHTGPKLQADIVDIITGFRLHKVVFTCDISKMYRQILIRPEDRTWQHILWRDSPVDSVQNFELRTVTYGVTSSPYLAIRTLHQLADDHGSQWPHAAEALRHHTFMDDITTGASCLTSALKLKDELISLLSCAKLDLRKWTSNCPQFLEQLPIEHCQSPKTFSDQDSRSILKILGVQWEPQADYFTYSVSNVDIEYTKRSILSNVARIFDPLGWVTPYVLTAKLLLQNLWRMHLGWDEQIPRDLTKDWNDFITDLDNLKHIKIPRQAVSTDATEVQLIGFCDGSTKAYGCCVYLRSVTDDEVQTSLLIAKSKVAPLKPLTVNRLELCGAALLARVLKHMVTLLSSKLNVTQVMAFSDSSTVLSWLNTEPHKLKTFVAHRVVKITDSIHQSKWKHVSTHDNPADYCSRGLSCYELAGCEQWWFGPHWLRSDPTQWPVDLEVETIEKLPELKSTSLLSHLAESDCLHLQLYRDPKDRFKKGQTKASLSLQQFLGFESGFTLDKESNTIAIICQDVVVVLAFETRERLIAWQVKVGSQLGTSREFLVLVGGGGARKLPAGPARLHLQGRRFALTSGVPPRLLGLWELPHLRRYGVVEGRFCFEGGSLSGKGEGLHVLITDQAQEITDEFDLATRGNLTGQRSTPSRKSAGDKGNKTRPSTRLSDLNNTLDQSLPDTSSGLYEENFFGEDCGRVSPYWLSDERRGSEDPDFRRSDIDVGTKPPWGAADHVTLERCTNCLTQLGVSRSSTVALSPTSHFNPAWTMDAVPESSSDSSSNTTEYLTPRMIRKSLEACQCKDKPPMRPPKPGHFDSKKPPAPLPSQCSCVNENNYPTNNPKVGPYENYDVPKPSQSVVDNAEYYDTPKRIKKAFTEDLFQVTKSSTPGSLVLKKNCGCILKFASKKKTVIVECEENIQPVECPCQKVTNWANNLISLPYCKRESASDKINTEILTNQKSEEMAIYATVDMSRKTNRQSGLSEKDNQDSSIESAFTNYQNFEPANEHEGPYANYENLEFALSLEYYENAKDLLKKAGVTQKELDALSANVELASSILPKKSPLCKKCGHSQHKTPEIRKNKSDEYLLMEPSKDIKRDVCRTVGPNTGYTPMSPNPNWSQSLKHPVHKLHKVEIEKSLSIPALNGDNKLQALVETSSNNNREAIQKRSCSVDSARLLEDLKEFDSSIGSHATSSSLETLRNLAIDNRRTSSPCDDERECYDCCKSSGSENKTSEESSSKVVPHLRNKLIDNAQIKRSSSVPCKSGGNRDSSSSNDSGVSSCSMKHGGEFQEFEMPLTSGHSRYQYMIHKRMRGNLSGCLHSSLPRKSKSSDLLREQSMQLYKGAASAKSSSAEAEVPVLPPKQFKGVLDTHSTSSGTSDMSDYIETLSLTSSHSSSDTPSTMRISRQPTNTLRPRSGKEYHNLDPIITSMYKTGKDLSNYTNLP